MRLKNIDLFKGILVLLVVLGHILQSKSGGSIFRSMIYSFHMPLFIGISGYLFNTDKLLKINFIELIHKYLFRIIIPWSIAVLFYYLVLIIQNHNKNILFGLFKSFINPYYHLWFIPGFLSWVILTWFFKKMKIGNKLMFIISLLISTTCFLFKQYPESYQHLSILKSLFGLILHTFRPHFYFFFVLGFVYRPLELKKPKLLEYILPLIFFLFVFFLFYKPNKLLSIANFFFLNGFLLSLILKMSFQSLIKENKMIEWIGLNSLAIYLWHVVPVLISKFTVGTENLTFFYTLTVSLELVLFIIYCFMLKIDFFKKYFFGM